MVFSILHYLNYETRKKPWNATIGKYSKYFFFQAEDGIRDIGVTGVQTCALPIWGDDDVAAPHEVAHLLDVPEPEVAVHAAVHEEEHRPPRRRVARREEVGGDREPVRRRVGDLADEHLVLQKRDEERVDVALLHHLPREERLDGAVARRRRGAPASVRASVRAPVRGARG